MGFIKSYEDTPAKDKMCRCQIEAPLKMTFETNRCFYDRRYWISTARFVDLWFRPNYAWLVVDDFGTLIQVPKPYQ